LAKLIAGLCTSEVPGLLPPTSCLQIWHVVFWQRLFLGSGLIADAYRSPLEPPRHIRTFFDHPVAPQMFLADCSRKYLQSMRHLPATGEYLESLSPMRFDSFEPLLLAASCVRADLLFGS
jgi:hypothetical protein